MTSNDSSASRSDRAARVAVAETLRALRRNRGLAQETLALLAGIDRAYMGKLERGVNSPSTETLFKILQAMSISYLRFAREVDRRYRKLIDDPDWA